MLVPFSGNRVNKSKCVYILRSANHFSGSKSGHQMLRNVIPKLDHSSRGYRDGNKNVIANRLANLGIEETALSEITKC